jgi:outer membrane protein OmpA-like peptidoglycan-associated protein
LLGCVGWGTDLEDAQATRPAGSEFQQSLYKEYLDYAKSEYAQGDYIDSDRSSLKAIASAKGQPPQPEQIAARDLPADKVGELTDARARLVRALDGGGRDRQAALAARAQSKFDCWMEQQEENFQPSHIASCRGDFMTAMGQLEDALRPRAAAAAAPTPAPTVQGKTFVVYFDNDSSKIKPDSQQVVLQAIDAAKASGTSQVSISGHTDRVGTERHNDKLSGMRADAVADVFKKGGVTTNVLRVNATGEADPAVNTPDGQPEPRNRRVVITVK